MQNVRDAEGAELLLERAVVEYGPREHTLALRHEEHMS